MQRERPNTDPDAGVADDKIAAARERAARIDRDHGLARQPDSDKANGNGDDALQTASISGRRTADDEDD
jgi:hypothetical protein